MRYFRKWVAFKCHYDKLIGKLNQLETQHFRTIKLRRFKAEDSIFMAANAG